MEACCYACIKRFGLGCADAAPMGLGGTGAVGFQVLGLSVNPGPGERPGNR